MPALLPILRALGSPPPHEASTFGVAAGAFLRVSPSMAADLDAIQASGATWVRFDLDWWYVQAGGSTSYDWTLIDDQVNGIVSRGMTPFASFANTPPWARPGGTGGWYPPTNNADFAAFAEVAAARYAALGVHHYQVWNEPNNEVFWEPGPNAADYTAMLKAVYPAIKNGDPTATVLTAGTAPAVTGGGSGGNISPVDFLTGVYANGGQGYFDALAHHPYTFPAYPDGTNALNAWYQMVGTSPSLRSLMVANGDGGKQIWATEYGAPTNGPAGEFVTEADQAEMCRRAHALWRSYSWSGPLFWYQHRDPSTDTSTRENFFGLLRYDFTGKPAYGTFERLTEPYAELIRATPGLKHYWRLGEFQGTVATDDSGTLNGSYVNAPTLGEPGLASTDSAVTLDGFSQTVTVSDDPSIDFVDAYSQEIWIKATDAANAGDVFTKPDAYYFARRANGAGEAGFLSAPGVYHAITVPTGTFVTGQAYHVAVTYDRLAGANNLKLYIDGAVAAQGTFTQAVQITTTALQIGSYNGAAAFFYGTIDEAAVYNVALPDATVLEHYETGAGTGALAGVSVGTSSLTGLLAVVAKASGALTGTSGATGVFAAWAALAGTAAGTSTLTGGLSVATPLTGTAAGLSITTGSLTVPIPVAGTLAGSSSASGALTARAGLSGTAAGASTAAGSVGAGSPLAGSAVGASGVTGALTARAGLGGASAGTSATIGALKASASVAGTLAGTSALTGGLSVTQPGANALTGTLAASSASSGALTVTASLAGQAQGTSTTAGLPTVTSGLAGALAGASTATGALKVAGALAGLLSSSSALAGTLTVTAAGQNALTGTLSGSSTAAGTLSVSKPLAGTLTGNSTTAGTAITGASLRGITAGTSAAFVALMVAHPLAGVLRGTATATGHVTVLRSLAGQLVGLSTLAGVLTNQGPISAVGRLESDFAVTFTESDTAISSYESISGVLALTE